MIKKYVYILIIGALALSCQRTYYRYSHLHHQTNKASLKILNPTKCKVILKNINSKKRSERIYVCIECSFETDFKNNDSCLVYLENQNVIYFGHSFWVKRNSPDSLIRKYTNVDINF